MIAQQVAQHTPLCNASVTLPGRCASNPCLLVRLQRQPFCWHLTPPKRRLSSCLQCSPSSWMVVPDLGPLDIPAKKRAVVSLLGAYTTRPQAPPSVSSRSATAGHNVQWQPLWGTVTQPSFPLLRHLPGLTSTATGSHRTRPSTIQWLLLLLLPGWSSPPTCGWPPAMAPATPSRRPWTSRWTACGPSGP